MSYFANNPASLYSYPPQRTTGINHLQQQQNSANNGALQTSTPSNPTEANALRQSQPVATTTPQTLPQPTQPSQESSSTSGPQPPQQTQPQQTSPTSVNASNPGASSSASDAQAAKSIRINRPGQRFGAKKKSWVWSWFVQDSQDPNIAACDYCGKIIMRLPSDKGSPKKLSEHLKVHKVSKETINYTRPVPVDGYGVTYNNNGEPIEYPPNYQEQQDSANTSSVTIPGVGPSARGISTSSPSVAKPRAPRFNPGDYSNLLSNRRFISNDFDNSNYSAMKFHKHLMKFLTENKLPISVIKSHSFQQLVYDLRSDSVNDLIDLTGLYNTLLEVSRLSETGHDGTQEADTSIVDRSTN
ncbi:hypothetical protein DFJ63DRAFT_314031 [Scheffersomyces coipomensis]|uniref:uncharacterized protein n=1 Tax=Scheffersomyces coipomensis TaxID=1788519 RepID=UPI00315C76FE